MGTIHTFKETNEVLIEDVNAAVHISGLGFVKGYRDAAQFLKVSKAAVRSCCRHSKAGQKIGKRTVRFATKTEVKDVFPEYVVLHHVKGGSASIAKPTNVYIDVGGHKHMDHHRSMTSARETHGLTQVVFDAIVAHTPGWKDLLPPKVIDIKVGVHPRKKKVSTTKVKGPFFDLNVQKSGRVSLVWIGPASVADVESIPKFVLNNS